MAKVMDFCEKRKSHLDGLTSKHTIQACQVFTKVPAKNNDVIKVKQACS